MRVAMAVAVTALIGCGTGEVDGVFVTANWRFQSVTSTVAEECPVPTVVMHVEGDPCHGECFDPLPAYDCAPGTATSQRLEPGVYDVWLDFVAEDGVTVYTTTTPDQLDLTLGDKTYARQIVTDGGVFKVAWKLRTPEDAVTSCEDAGVFGISISALSAADPGEGHNDEVPCAPGTGYSFPYAEGDYDVMLEAVNDVGQPLGMTLTTVMGTITKPNGVTDLGSIEIQLTPPNP